MVHVCVRQRTLSMRPTPSLVEPPISSICLALRRAQRIERDVSEAEEARAACGQGSPCQVTPVILHGVVFPEPPLEEKLAR